MKAVVQRVARASVRVDGEVIGSVGKGLLVLLGVAAGDPPGCEELLARKIVDLRIFPDAEDKMNLAVGEVGGGLLVVSQFTLLADCKKGRRPSFINAAPPEEANKRYEKLCALVRAQGLEVQTGRFGASMEVELINDGPVTIVLDTRELLT
jgi:D-aminoacyl-tRNA deacylase